MAVQIEYFSFLTTHIVVCESKVELLFNNSAFLIQKITQAEFGSTYVMGGAPTYRKNEHGNIQGKQTGIILRGGIATVGL